MKLDIELTDRELRMLADALADKAVAKADVPALLDKIIGGFLK